MSELMKYLVWLGLHAKLDSNQTSKLVQCDHATSFFFSFSFLLVFRIAYYSNTKIYRFHFVVRFDKFNAEEHRRETSDKSEFKTFARFEIENEKWARKNEQDTKSVWSDLDKLPNRFISIGHKDTYKCG